MVIRMANDVVKWVLKPENSLVWHHEVLGWINKYSGVTDKTTLASRTDESRHTTR
jgi:hypothetical protein